MGDELQLQVEAARALAREVNKQIERVAIRFDSSEGEFLCECGNADCNARLRLTLEEYEVIRADDNRFFVATGHELAPADRVVQRTARYVVAESTGLAPA